MLRACVPNTSTKKLNGSVFFKQMLNGTSTNSPGLSTPSEKSPIFGTVNVAPTPAGPPSAFCSKFPFVKAVTVVRRPDRGGLLLWSVNRAWKLNFPAKPEGQPVVLDVVLKVDVSGSND